MPCHATGIYNCTFHIHFYLYVHLYQNMSLIECATFLGGVTHKSLLEYANSSTFGNEKNKLNDRLLSCGHKVAYVIEYGNSLALPMVWLYACPLEL